MTKPISRLSECFAVPVTSNISGAMTYYYCPDCMEQVGWTQGDALLHHDPGCPQYTDGRDITLKSLPKVRFRDLD